MLKRLPRIIPAASWLATYQRGDFLRDGVAACIVTALLIPQSLAYALLAGLPPQAGLYASILPLLGYALFGSSRTLSVGPVSVVSLMTAAALGKVAAQGTTDYLTAATTLAMLCGLFLTIIGILKLGFITNFISHGVISGFISASGILIAASQMQHIMGTRSQGETLPELLPAIVQGFGSPHIPTLIMGVVMFAYLLLVRKHLTHYLCLLGMSPHHASLISKAAPVLGVGISLTLAWFLDLQAAGVSLTGTVPASLPALGLSIPSWELLQNLAPSALLISLIGYVESVSVGKTLGAKRRQRIDPNRELIGLGAANLASSVSGAFPVAGGFSRSIVNFEAGAVTQMASVLTAFGIALASLCLSQVLYYLPQTTLAAVIIAAVLPLVDLSILRRTWRFARADCYAIITTIAVTLLTGVESGLACGILVSIALHLHRTSRPHIAEVGLLPGTEHFRNVARYKVDTVPEILSLRPDESLFFANSAFLEDRIRQLVYERGDIAHVVILCSAVNEIDFSALETLESLNQQLADQGVQLHLSEVKGPVMDNLQLTGFLTRLSGHVHLRHIDAFNTLKEAESRSSARQ